MSMKVRALLVGVIIMTEMWLVGCGHYNCGVTLGNSSCSSSGGGFNQGGNGGLKVTAFVYFMYDRDAQMAAEALNFNNSGTFAPYSQFVSPALPLSLGSTDGGLIVAAKKYLYIPFANGVLYGYSIDSTGQLTALTGSPYTLSSGGYSIAADPAGKLLFVGGQGEIMVYTINADGSLTTAPGSPVSSGGGLIATQMVTDGLGKYLYAVQGSTVAEFSYSQAGTLASLGTPPSLGMSMLAPDVSGKYILGITGLDGSQSGLVDNHIYVFGISGNGTLSAVQNSPFSTSSSPVWLAASPTAELVYTCNDSGQLGSQSITTEPMEGYSIDASTGALTPVSGSPFTTLSTQFARFEQSGQFMFAAMQENNSGSTVPIGVDSSTGALSNTLPFAGNPSYSFVATDEP